MKSLLCLSVPRLRLLSKWSHHRVVDIPSPMFATSCWLCTQLPVSLLRRSRPLHVYTAEHGMSTTKITRQLWGKRSRHNPDGKPQSDFLEKTPADSTVSVDYDFIGDRELKEQYSNLSGRLRVGALLEDMDALAGNCAHLHADDFNETTRPYNVVTATVEDIVVRRPRLMNLEMNIRAIGRVVAVGCSSMDVRIEVVQLNEKDPNPPILMTASFLMVAIDSVTGSPARINSLKLAETSEEREWAREAAVRKELRQENRARQTTKSGFFNEEELRELHNVLVESPHQPHQGKMGTRVLRARRAAADANNGCGDRVSRLSSVALCNPQMRNWSGNIFGGFLMRVAYELAWSTAHMYCRTPPSLCGIGSVSFLRPVSVGNLVESVASISAVDSKYNRLVVNVDLNILCPLDGTSRRSNSLEFVFSAPLEVHLPSVVPVTYDDGLLWIEGRRVLKEDWLNSTNQ